MVTPFISSEKLWADDGMPIARAACVRTLELMSLCTYLLRNSGRRRTASIRNQKSWEFRTYQTSGFGTREPHAHRKDVSNLTNNLWAFGDIFLRLHQIKSMMHIVVTRNAAFPTVSLPALCGC
jgi:hypothetical protein